MPMQERRLEQSRRLTAAMNQVQSDLDSTVEDAPQLVILFVHDELQDGELSGHVADQRGRSSGSAMVAGEDEETALWTVAEGAQEYMADLRFTAWPECPQHGRGMHIRDPSGSPATSDAESAQKLPVWWCSASGGHDVAQVGKLNDGRASLE
jgi:hypothetical protein